MLGYRLALRLAEAAPALLSAKGLAIQRAPRLIIAPPHCQLKIGR